MFICTDSPINIHPCANMYTVSNLLNELYVMKHTHAIAFAGPSSKHKDSGLAIVFAVKQLSEG